MPQNDIYGQFEENYPQERRSQKMSQTVRISQLFKNAEEEGMLSSASIKALNIVDLGAQIQQGLGISVDDVQASEVVLVTMMPDDSGSIRFVSGNAQAVRDGHNTVLAALKESKQEDNILVHTRYLNGFVLYPYSLLSQAILMDQHNYDPDLGTPLYDQTVVLLGTVLAKTQEFVQNGVPARTITLIVTDGHDQHSAKHTARSVKPLVDDMLMTETTHIIAAMGVDDGGTTDFRRIFHDMGLRDEWILTPKNTPSEIRKAFRMFSKSAVRASQSAKSFSQTALGGFGNP